MFPSGRFPLNRDKETRLLYLFDIQLLVQERKANSCVDCICTINALITCCTA